MERGFIPFVIVFFFGLLTSFIFIAICKIAFENYAFYHVKTELNMQETMVYSDSLTLLKDVSEERFVQIENSLIVGRIKQGMHRLFKTQDTNALMEYFKLRSEIEYEEMETSFTSIKYINWLIPTLGFIGTVLGIGSGITGFTNIIENADKFGKVKEALPLVTHDLGVAFDTTFLALVVSVIGMFLSSLINKRYNNLLENLDSFCLDEISCRFKLHSTVAEEMKEVFRTLRNDIENLLNASRIETINNLEGLNESIRTISEATLAILNKNVDLSGLNEHLSIIKEKLTNIGKNAPSDNKQITEELRKISKKIEGFNHKGKEIKQKSEKKPKD